MRCEAFVRSTDVKPLDPRWFTVLSHVNDCRAFEKVIGPQAADKELGAQEQETCPSGNV